MLRAHPETSSRDPPRDEPGKNEDGRQYHEDYDRSYNARAFVRSQIDPCGRSARHFVLFSTDGCLVECECERRYMSSCYRL